MGKRKTKRGKAARNARKGICNAESEEITKAPHSMVINRGKLGKNGNELLLNLRKIMEPYTASHLKVQKQNVLKDFVHIAGPLHVTHLLVLTKTEIAMYLRVAKLPHGPTLTFQIKEYSLVKDIISSQKKSVIYDKLFEHHPLLVLNNFSGDGMHIKLMATTFQNMFPSINVNKTNLNTIRRCLLLNYNSEINTLELRQYAIKVVPTGMSKAVKKLIQSKVPDLGIYKEMEHYLDKSGNLSESEAELDLAANTVTLSQSISSRGNIASEKSAIRLFEIGPRLTLELVKIQEGLMGGEVLYHQFIQKTPEEIKALKDRIKAKKILKEKRKTEQLRNVENKKIAKAEIENKGKEDAEEPENDLDYYRQEVGEEPDQDVIPSLKRKNSTNSRPTKKRKFSDDSKSKKQSDSISRSNKKTKLSYDAKSKKQSDSKKSDKEFQEFIKKRKKRREAKSSKQKTKKKSTSIMAMKAKFNDTRKQSKKV